MARRVVATDLKRWLDPSPRVDRCYILGCSPRFSAWLTPLQGSNGAARDQPRYNFAQKIEMTISTVGTTMRRPSAKAHPRRRDKRTTGVGCRWTRIVGSTTVKRTIARIAIKHSRKVSSSAAPVVQRAVHHCRHKTRQFSCLLSLVMTRLGKKHRLSPASPADASLVRGPTGFDWCFLICWLQLERAFLLARYRPVYDGHAWTAGSSGSRVPSVVGSRRRTGR